MVRRLAHGLHCQAVSINHCFSGMNAMHCVQIAELASLLSRRATALLLLRHDLNQEGLNRYWIQSRQRFNEWHRRLKEHSNLEYAGRPLAMQVWWQEQGPLIEEIIVTETLTRVVAAIGMGLDAINKQNEIEPITHSVYVSHLEVRNRVLHLLLFGRGGSVSQSIRLNRLRRATERWIDRLLSPLLKNHGQVRLYAVDGLRALTHSQQWREDYGGQFGLITESLNEAAIRSSLYSQASPEVALPNANREIAQAVLACLPVACFDSFGLMKSKSGVRLSVSGSDTSAPVGRTLFPVELGDDRQEPVLPTKPRWLY